MCARHFVVPILALALVVIVFGSFNGTLPYYIGIAAAVLLLACAALVWYYVLILLYCMYMCAMIPFIILGAKPTTFLEFSRGLICSCVCAPQKTRPVEKRKPNINVQNLVLQHIISHHRQRANDGRSTLRFLPSQ